jgi:hypothetical protein
MSALDSTDPSILQTALTNLMTVADAKLAIDKSHVAVDGDTGCCERRAGDSGRRLAGRGRCVYSYLSAWRR